MTHARFGAMTLALLAGTAASLRASDVTWDNGTSNSQWDTTSLNWSGASWNNAAANGAIFGPAGVGAIDVAVPVVVDSMDFRVDGYTLNGPAPINFAAGISSLTTGVVNVATGATAKIFTGINSAVGFQKIGAGVLELSAPCTFGGAIPLFPRGELKSDLLVGGVSGPIAAGTLRLLNGGVVPASTKVSIANGLLDIGSNTVTLSELIFVNKTTPAAFDPLINAAGAGLIGNGTLRVTGDINVIGAFSGENLTSNTIAANLDMGGGTQVVRMGVGNSFGQSSTLQFTGTISNGSLLKTVGLNPNGVQAAIDGMGLFGNNTYTGATLLNGGVNVVTGTNASTSVVIHGPQGAGGGNIVSLQGANGSYQSASTIRASAGGIFVIDNNAALGGGASSQPNIPAAQNNDRIRDDAEVRLRDGGFVYRGQSTMAASETFGNLNVLGGHNTVTLTPNGAGGTATLTASGNLSMAPRATMQVATTTLGAASKMFVNGTLPAADATGILPRMVGTSDYLTYNGATGLTPYTGYAPDFTTPGTNVAISASTAVASSVNINALKNSAGGATTLTIGAGQTLGVTSGMILNSGFGTSTIAGGTLDFGSTPGVLFGTGNIVVSAPVTGTDGLISARGTNTLSGDLSGLSGTITTSSGTLNLTTNTFAGALEVRAGTLNINMSQTLAGQGAITMGEPLNDANLIAHPPFLNIAGAGANAVIARDIIFDNGTQTAGGADLRYSVVGGAISPLSNTTGSQTISGNVILNSPARIQGGGAGGTGSTNFTGDFSGPAKFHIPNGRVSFTGNIANAGGFAIADQGFSAQVTFAGTASGSWPIRISGGNNIRLSYMAGSLSSGPISIWNTGVSTQVNIFPLNNSTIINPIDIGSNAAAGGHTTVNVGAGITAEWAGLISGGGPNSPLTKSGTGTLILSNPSNTYTGATTVSAGRLQVDGLLASTSVTVASGATLGGVGDLTGSALISAGGVIAPGNSVGTLSTGNLSLLGVLNADIDLSGGGSPFADLLTVMGGVSMSSATLDISLANLPSGYAGGVFLVVANDGADPVSGAFGAITGLPAGYSATIDYDFGQVDSLGRAGDGNDIAIRLVPSPSAALAIGAFGAAQLTGRRRRARQA